MVGYRRDADEGCTSFKHREIRVSLLLKHVSTSMNIHGALINQFHALCTSVSGQNSLAHWCTGGGVGHGGGGGPCCERLQQQWRTQYGGQGARTTIAEISRCTMLYARAVAVVSTAQLCHAPAAAGLQLDRRVESRRVAPLGVRVYLLRCTSGLILFTHVHYHSQLLKFKVCRHVLTAAPPFACRNRKWRAHRNQLIIDCSTAI